MRFAKPLLFFTLYLFVFVNSQAQVGEKFYGRASYYADKFHGRATSSGEAYDREEYTAAHRDLPFNTIVEIVNTINNRTAVVKINDRGPFAYNRMIDLSFAAARDLELLGSGEAQVEMKILSMDNPEYTIASFYSGAKGEFNREFRQYEPVIIGGKNGTKVTLDTTYTITMPQSLQPKPVTEAFVIADSLRRKQAEGDKMGFRQHKYIRVLKDADGRYRLDSSIVTPPTPQEAYSVAPQNHKFNSYESRPVIPKSEPVKQVAEIPANNTEKTTKITEEEVKSDVKVSGFRQHQYVRVYTDSEGRIRLDTTTQKTPVQLAKNINGQVVATDDKAKPYNASLPNSPKLNNTATVVKSEATKPKEAFGFRQHSYIKVYKDKDGKTRLDTTSFERPQ
ncbi:MAG: septal ring lytic transglycosylase RlpA family protein [Bacteroidota bacterium]